MRVLTLFTLIIILSGCSGMKPIDFKDQKPRLVIEKFLKGNVKAYGILQNRSGKVTRQFSADLNGKWDGKELILDEKFNWSDGEVQTRQWKIIKKNNNYYEGTAADAVSYTHLTLPTNREV